MSKVWNIYSKDALPTDAPKYIAESLEYHDTWMGEEYVSVTIVSPNTPNKTETDAFSLEIGDYIQYRGRIYSIYNVPSAIKQARVKSYGEAFKYENVKFSSRAMELTEIRFLDIVLGDNQLHYTSLPTFSAYCETVDDLVDRLQANTDRIKDSDDYWFFITPSKQRTLQRIIKWDPTANNNNGAWVPDTERRAVAELLWNEYFSVDADVANEKKNVNIQVDKASVWDGLSYVKQHFGLNFITNVNSYGRNVIIGASAKHTENTFRYGKNNGLHQIERVADADQLVVTKLYAYGSDKNLPYHYYNDINIRPYLKVTGSYSSAPVGISVLLENIAYDGGAFTNMILDDGSKRWYTFTCKITNGSSSVICDGNAEMVRISDSQNCTVRLYLATTGSTAGMKFTPQDKIDAVKDIFNNTNPITGIDVIFLSDTDISKFPSNRHTALTDGMPDNMSVNCLMLPGFPVYALNDIVKCEYIEVENEQLVDETRFYVRNTPDDSYSQIPSFIIPGYHVFVFSEDRLRPWIKSPNAAELGIKEGDVHFTEESDDNGLQDVHPSIEGMTENDVFHNGSTARLDEIESADVITDNGVFAEGVTVRNFKVRLKNLGFDLRAAYANAGSSMQLCMKDGYCGGRNFNVKGVNSIIDNNGNITGWELNVERLRDESLELYFPYSDKAAHGQTPIANEPYQIRGEIRDGNNELVYAGDHFVLTDILIQDTNYIHAASVELFRKSCIWLAANDYTRFTYLPKIDEIFMARDKDTAYRAEYDTIKAGKLMKFEDEDLQINGSVYIDQLTIKEGGNKDIPTFDVTLREDKQVGKLDRMQNQINSLTFAAGDSGGAALRYLKSIWDFDANGNLFTKYNVYSLLGISALGYSEGGSGGGGATSLDDLVNVEIASPTDGQVLKYNAQTHKWINGNDEGVTSVLWSNILNKPTTIGGYGITDAYISNGVIHIGGVDITPLTSFTETDPTVPSWAKAPTKPSYAFSEITGTATSSQIPSLDAAKITSGIFSVSQIPDITISKITDFPSKWAWSDIDNKPTTLSGYGITDVTIADGVITLGTGNTITPVTSVAMTVPTGFAVTGSPITKTGTLALAYSAGYEGFTTTLKNKIDLLYSLFTREGSGTSADPYIIKANYGLYTEQFLSALGLNSQQGSSGALYSLLDVKPDDPTNPSKVYGAQTGYVLTYGSDGKWYAAHATGSVTSIIVGTTTYSPVNGVITLPAYPQVPSWALQPNKPSYAFSEITGSATASQVPNIEDLDNFSTKVYDASATRIANTVLAAPNGSNGAASFRALVGDDLPTASASVKGGVIVGTGLAIASAVLGLATSGVTAGTYTKMTVDAYGRATYGTTLGTSDIPDLSGTYLSLNDGGTVRGVLRMNDDAYLNGQLNIKDSSVSNSYTRIQYDSLSDGLYITFDSSTNAQVYVEGGGHFTGDGYFEGSAVVDGSLDIGDVLYAKDAIRFYDINDALYGYGFIQQDDHGLYVSWSGTNDLVRKLSVNGAVDISGNVFLNDATFTQQYEIGSPDDPEYANLTIEDGIITLDESGKIQSSDEFYYFDNSGNAALSSLAVSGNVTIGGTLKIGDIYIAYDSINNALKVYKLNGNSQEVAANFYALGGVSALGYSASGGGGASALSDLTDVQITNVANGQILRYDGTHWINVTPNYATTTQLANYLPLSGGTLTGALTVNSSITFGLANYQTLVDSDDSGVTFSGANGGYFFDSDIYINSYQVATRNWVSQQGYLTSAPVTSVAGYTGAVTVANLATALSLSNYATETWVTNQGYITSSGSCNYATSAGSAQILGCDVAQGSTTKADGDVLVYDSGAWYNTPRATYLSGYATTSQLGNYLPLTGGTLTGALGKSSNYLIKPVADYRTTNDTHTGCITITLPANIGKTMVSMWIDVYNYSTNTSFSVHCGGYTYSNDSTWRHNPFAMVYGASHRVRFGHNGTNFVIYIGETDSTWRYPQVTVRDVILGHEPAYEYWYNDWSVSFVTSVSNVTADYTRYVITSSNISSQSVSYAASAGNAATATKLQTARTIWGQSFDGSGNVTGDIYFPADSGIVLDTDSYIHVSDSDSYLHIDGYDAMVFEVNHTERMRITSNGRVGIGKYPSFALDVNGTIHGSIAQVGNGYINQGKEFGFIDGGFRIYQYEDFDEDDPNIWLYLHDNGKFDADDFGTIFLNNAPIVVNCDVEFCDAEQSSFVGKSIKAGNIYMNSNLVATQSWVGNQGYIKPSISDPLADGVVLVYDSGAWVTSSRSNFLFGYATQSWVQYAALSSYLPLSGGTMTDTLNMSNDNPISFDIDNNIYASTYGSNSSRLYISACDGIRLLIANQNQVTHGYLDITDSGIEINKALTINMPSVTYTTPMLTLSNQDIDVGLSGDSNGLYINTGLTTASDVYVGGNVGVGTTSPQYKLHVDGTGYFSGALTVQNDNGIKIQNLTYNTNFGRLYNDGYEFIIDSLNGAGTSYLDIDIYADDVYFNTDNQVYGDFVQTSDIRLKNVWAYDVLPNVEAIAYAPSIRYTWNELAKTKNKNMHLGSVAQYWQSILPEAVVSDKDGYLAMNYDVIALLSAISVAKRVTEHERRIEQLERENALLRMEINELKDAA